MHKPMSDLSKFKTVIKTRLLVRDNGCHEWTGKVDKNGYGRVRVMVGGKTSETSAHRLALYQHTGEQQEAMVLHSCDNALCCNPEHLRYGNAQDNYDDMVARERRWDGGREGERKLKLWVVKLLLQGGYTKRQVLDTVRIRNWDDAELDKV